MATYNGTTGNDTLDGTIGGNVNDTLNGDLGNDLYIFNLGSGDDVITDTGGFDTILLGDPNNLYTGIWDAYRSGNNLVFDFDGPGTLTVTNQFLGAPVVEAVTFTDEPGKTFYFTNSLVGAASNDVIVGTSAGELMDGAGGEDKIFGNAGNDTILGGDGSDQILGGLGDDSISGGGGDDELIGDAGNNTIDGGAGFDHLTYEGSPSAITANFSGAVQGALANNQVSSGGYTDITIGIEEVVGSDLADVFYSGRTTGADARLGYISFIGMGGNDTFYIGGGGYGAYGHVSYGWNATQGVVVNLSNALINVGGVDVASMTARDGLGGIDTFVLQGVTFGIQGSDFNDYIRGSDNYSNNLDGGAGNDTIIGGALSDSVSYTYGNGGTYGAIVNLSGSSITVTGGVTGDNGANVTVLAGQARDGWGGTDTLTSIEGVSGTQFNDYILGSAAANGLYGQSGNDTLIGGDGNDSLNGGVGADTLVGGAGNDYLDGGTITDRYNGTDNNFTTYSGSAAAVNVNLGIGMASDGLGGTDTLVNINQVQGSNYADSLTGSTALVFEQFEGGLGNDTIDGGAITDILNQSNNNRVTYQNAGGAVTVDLAAGTASGAAGNDTLVSFNQVRGSSYNDILLGSDSWLTERFEGRAGNDTIDGRGGTDWTAYDGSSSAVIVNLVTGTASDGYGSSDTLINIEGIRGSNFGDLLIGGLAANGTTVNDGLFELFLGNGGNDTIDGGQGYDRADYLTAMTGVTVTLNDTLDGSASDGLGGTDVLRNIEGIRGSIYNDTLTGSDTAPFESFEGREGNDQIDGKGGIDRADYYYSESGVVVNLAAGTANDGYGGIDTLSNIEDVRGSRDFNDSITGNSSGNKFEGFGGNDTLDGGDGNDSLDGGDGNDSLSGGAGADILIGGAGNDYLDGGTIINRYNGTDNNVTSYLSSAAAVNVNLNLGMASDGLGGTDTLVNINRVQGSNYADYLTGSTALVFEEFEGGLGNDTLDGGTMTDTLNQYNTNRISYTYAAGAVTVDLAAGAASGAAGNDTFVNFNQIRGSSYNDILLGSDSSLSERFEGRAGNDTIDGRGGTDWAAYDYSSSAVIVNLVTGTASDGYGSSDTLINIEGIRGSNFGDLLIGGLAANGTTVNDGLFELFLGNGGNDTIDGGQGYDRADYLTAMTGVTVTLNDTLDGSASDGLGGTDVLRNIEGIRGSIYNDTLTGSDTAPFESFEGREGNDQIDGKGGIDRADYYYSESGVVVNLAAGTANDGYGGIDTLSNIEDVRGSRDFNDSITGNSSGNKFEGFGGNDILDGGQGTDTAIYSGTNSGYSISRSDSTWTVTDTNLADGNEGTDTLTGIEYLQFSDGTRSLVKTAASDFNGDSKSDILWRNASSGADAIWNGADNGSGVPVGGVADLTWKVAGAGDFNGDGKSDILWRNASSGADAIWNGADSGDSLAVGAVADLNWKVAGVGDFNGDGKSDILWRNASSGANGLWNGGNSGDSLAVGAVADLNWKVAGVGDFNGDSKDDILWRNASTGYNAIWNGGDNSNGLPMGEVTDLNWQVAGTGDFNGDGKDDVLWRNASTGYNAIWNGGDNSNGLPMGEVTDLNWQVAGTGDYNGDGKDDVLWRNASSGADAIWNGGDNSSSLPVGEVTDLNWQIPAQTNSWLTAAGDYPV